MDKKKIFIGIGIAVVVIALAVVIYMAAKPTTTTVVTKGGTGGGSASNNTIINTLINDGLDIINKWVNKAGGYTQVAPIDPTTGCDANGLDKSGNPCA